MLNSLNERLKKWDSRINLVKKNLLDLKVILTLKLLQRAIFISLLTKIKKIRIWKYTISRHQETNTDTQMSSFLTKTFIFRIMLILKIYLKTNCSRYTLITAYLLTCTSLKLDQAWSQRLAMFLHTWSKWLQLSKRPHSSRTCSSSTIIDGESQLAKPWMLILNGKNCLETSQLLIIMIMEREPHMMLSGQKIKSSLMLPPDLALRS